MSTSQPPSLYEWICGMPTLERLTQQFYNNVLEDPLLHPIFAHMDDSHPHYVAQFLAEVFGGPASYTTTRGGHPHMVTKHLERHLNQQQRQRWVQLLLEAADATELPDDPEFRSAFIAYIEWGTRIAVINSQPGAQVDPTAAMPRWGWGEVGGPYQQ